MIITRAWAMPDSRTFSIKPIRALIDRYNSPEYFSIDPFANDCDIATVTNDLDPDSRASCHLDALDFLRTVNMQTTQSSFWSNLKKEIACTVKPNGLAMSFGWNSGGIGKTLGFEQVEILLVAHGGAHNDTICVVERKLDT